jgi:hypothetical protein
VLRPLAVSRLVAKVEVPKAITRSYVEGSGELAFTAYR